MEMILLIALLGIGGISANLPIPANFGQSILMEDPLYFVMILRKTEYKCAGALISWHHVLTVAHCVVDESYKRYSDLLVASGTLKKNTFVSIHDVEHVIHPRGFVRAPENEMQDDIAVLILREDTIFYGDEQPIELPSMRPTYNIQSRVPTLSPKAELITFKYGNQSDDVSLYKVATAVHPDKKCFAGRFEFDEDSDVFCGVNNKDELSHVDVGSPLIQHESVVGLATFTRPRNLSRNNYINIHKYLPFIEKAIFAPDSSCVVL